MRVLTLAIMTLIAKSLNLVHAIKSNIKVTKHLSMRHISVWTWRVLVRSQSEVVLVCLSITGL